MKFKPLRKEDFFYCYSINLFHYLKANGFYYVVKGFNPRTKKNYWVFERTPEFLEALTVFTNNKKKK
jgi:hypothetical protein